MSAMKKIVEVCNNHIRQILNPIEFITTFTVNGTNMYDEAKGLVEDVAKDSGLKNPFEDTRKIFLFETRIL